MLRACTGTGPYPICWERCTFIGGVLQTHLQLMPDMSPLWFVYAAAAVLGKLHASLYRLQLYTLLVSELADSMPHSPYMCCMSAASISGTASKVALLLEGAAGPGTMVQTL